VSIHLVPPVLLHHIAVLTTVTETDNVCSCLMTLKSNWRYLVLRFPNNAISFQQHTIYSIK
jgi:hypothetical protein